MESEILHECYLRVFDWQPGWDEHSKRSSSSRGHQYSLLSKKLIQDHRLNASPPKPRKFLPSSDAIDQGDAIASKTKIYSSSQTTGFISSPSHDGEYRASAPRARFLAEFCLRFFGGFIINTPQMPTARDALVLNLEVEKQFRC